MEKFKEIVKGKLPAKIQLREIAFCTSRDDDNEHILLFLMSFGIAFSRFYYENIQSTEALVEPLRPSWSPLGLRIWVKHDNLQLRGVDH